MPAPKSTNPDTTRKSTGPGKNGKGRGNANSHDRAAATALRERRVRHLMLLLATGSYVTHVTAAQLATEPDPSLPENERGWGLSQDYIERLAGEAAGRLRERCVNNDVINSATLSTLEFIRARCMQTEDFKTAIQATLAINGLVVSGGKLDVNGQLPRDAVININNILPQGVLEAARANEAGGQPAAPVVAVPAVATDGPAGGGTKA